MEKTFNVLPADLPMKCSGCHEAKPLRCQVIPTAGEGEFLGLTFAYCEECKAKREGK